MSIFEVAMKMEEDGRNFYLENAKKAEDQALKRILTELADDELKHYNIFKAMRDSQSAEYKEAEKTTILASVKNVFEAYKAEGKEFSFGADTRTVWEEAREVEKKAEEFYRQKADELDDANQKSILHKIADEEHRHWVTMENVIQFLDRPSQWLEDAEWSNLDK